MPDGSPFEGNTHDGLSHPDIHAVDFWAVAARHYRKVRIVLAGNGSRGWGTPAPYGATNGLATVALYLARVDRRRLAVLNARVREQLESGAFEVDTLYLLNGETYRWPVSRLDPAADLLGGVDGFVVLAPGWQRCATSRTTTEVVAVR